MSARIDELMGNALVNGSMADSREEVEAMNLDSIADFYRQIYTNLMDWYVWLVAILIWQK